MLIVHSSVLAYKTQFSLQRYQVLKKLEMLTYVYSSIVVFALIFLSASLKCALAALYTFVSSELK